MSTDIIAPPPTAAAPPMAAGDTPTAPVANELPADKPPSEPKITGLTPEQVLQELKKSGYVDQLRRQMFDAFTASAATSTIVSNSTTTADVLTSEGATSASTDAPSSVTPTTNDAVSAPTHAALPTASTATPPTSTTSSSSSSTAPLNIATKPPFLSFLSTPLRTAVEKHHANLRSSDPRGQHDALLKALESDPVEHPNRESLGEATVYDLLVRHLVSGQQADGATAGLLGRQGKVGREAWGRIAEVVEEMVNPSSKEGDGEEDEDDDEDQEEEGQQVQTEHVAGNPQTKHTQSTPQLHKHNQQRWTKIKTMSTKERPTTTT